MRKYEMELAIENQTTCPYGRKAIVGDKRCINCVFNKPFNRQCLGDEESVKKHMERLGLDY